jgi:hypothetical protein
MNQNAEACLVTGYESLVDGLSLPDPDDRHVLAAAIKTGAHVIVTFNLDDFPEDPVGTFGIEAQHPDVFLAHLLDLHTDRFCSAVRRHRESLVNPPATVAELLAKFEAVGLTTTATNLREHVDAL